MFTIINDDYKWQLKPSIFFGSITYYSKSVIDDSRGAIDDSSSASEDSWLMLQLVA